MSQPLIKLLLLAGIAVVAVMAMRGRSSAGHRAFWRLSGTLVLLAGAFGVLFPDSLTSLAHAVGVGRGVDLILYVLVVAFLLVTVILFRKIGELERRMTLLVRELALMEARGPHRDPGDPGRAV